MAIVFFDVRTQLRVEVDESKVIKTKVERQLREGKVLPLYVFQTEYHGRTLTKLCSKIDWELLQAHTSDAIVAPSV